MVPRKSRFLSLGWIIFNNEGCFEGFTVGCPASEGEEGGEEGELGRWDCSGSSRYWGRSLLCNKFFLPEGFTLLFLSCLENREDGFTEALCEIA